MGVAEEEGGEMSNADKFIGKIRAVGIEPTDFLLLEINPDYIVQWANIKNLLEGLKIAGFHNVRVVLCSGHMKITSIKKGEKEAEMKRLQGNFSHFHVDNEMNELCALCGLAVINAEHLRSR